MMSQPSAYVLHVIKAQLNIPLSKPTSLYVEVELPKGRRVTRMTACVGGCLEWNQTNDFESTDSYRLSVKVRRRSFRIWKSDLGQREISVGELKERWGSGKDCEIELYDPKSWQIIGNIILRLEPKTSISTSYQVTSARNDLDSLRSKTKESVEISTISRKSSSNPASKEIVDQDSGLQALGSLQQKLQHFSLQCVPPLMTVMKEASKVHPYVNAAWSVVDSLYQAYNKTKAMEGEIAELVQAMDGILTFVENIETLNNKLEHFADTVKEILVTVKECCSAIRRYVEADGTARTWKSFVDAEHLGNFKAEFEKLSKKLNNETVVHIALQNEQVIGGVSGLNDKQDIVIATVERIERRISESPSSSPVPSQNVTPPLPTEIFTGRDDYLQKMERSFGLPKTSIDLNTQRRFILHGTGGMGKTQLALKFLDKNNNIFTVRYMIDASSKESIINSFASIGRSIGIHDGDINKILDWLCRHKEEWALLFDNADDPNVPLHLFFPNCRHGNILITTRNASFKTLAPKSHHIEVSTLNKSSAVQLFLQASEIDLAEAEEQKLFDIAEAIVEDFGYLALAVVQAGSYIATRSLDLSEYHSMFRSNRARLMRKALGPNVQYPQPVFTTWEISYAALSDNAASFLDICSFLYREGITEEIFLRAATSLEASLEIEEIKNTGKGHAKPVSTALTNLIAHLREEDGRWNKASFVDLIHELRSYSLIAEQFKGVYSIHPLVHEWARDRLTLSQQTVTQNDTQRLLRFSIPPYDDTMHIPMSKLLLPHLKSCGTPFSTPVASAFAGAYKACGRWKDEEILRRHVLEEAKHVLGYDHPYTLTSVRNLLSALFQQSRLVEVVQLHGKVIESRLRVLGGDHPDTLTSMDDLACAYRKQNRTAEAERLHEKVLHERRRVLGADHPDTLTSMDGLASTYLRQSRRREAEKLKKEVVDARIRVLGTDHPTTLHSMANLAVIYHDQNRLGDAVKLGYEVVETRKRVLGIDHPDTLGSMTDLALALKGLNRLDEAEQLSVETLERKKASLGIDDRHTLTSMNNLAMLYWDRDRFADAKNLQVHAVEASIRILGPKHPSTLRRKNRLALIYVDMELYDEAKAVYEPHLSKDTDAVMAKLLLENFPNSVSRCPPLIIPGVEVVETVREDDEHNYILLPSPYDISPSPGDQSASFEVNKFDRIQ